jgi:hypothetical protein
MDIFVKWKNTNCITLPFRMTCSMAPEKGHIMENYEGRCDGTNEAARSICGWRSKSQEMETRGEEPLKKKELGEECIG